MNTFTPVFKKILDSSIWDEPYHIRILWTAMLALKDSDHVVRFTAYNLHKRANITQEEVVDGLKVLSSPDKRRLEQQAFDGRRIKKVDDGWLILNGDKYEQEMRDVSRKFYKARWERNKREKVKIGKSKSASPIAGSAGERAYCKAIENGESIEKQDGIVTDNLPEAYREETVPYQS